MYRRQGKYQYDGAERLYERALAINRATFKDDHPEIAENLNGCVSPQWRLMIATLCVVGD